MISKDEEYMELAIKQANKCKPVDGAYSVGAVLVNDGGIISQGYSREIEGNTHAEECCFLKLNDQQINYNQCTIYTTMEPCSERLSGKKPCLNWILEKGVKRVVCGIKEPDNFVNCNSTNLLLDNNITVIYLDGFQDLCLQPNSHLIK
ncbi:hypothetical protein K502DRAFT_211123 [Neoconidiobolus thromboides FSU 785]|nr:hypothetical protein K502DRAFT_211123 [Neoconidiobolus thromboides FSU 785]